MRSLNIVTGNPTQEELVAITSAIQAFKQKQQAQVNLISEPQNTSGWLLSGRLHQTAIYPWGSKGSAWQRSERLSNPWHT